MNQHMPKVYTCIIKYDDEVPSEGFCCEIVKGLFIATDKIGQTYVIKELDHSGTGSIIESHRPQYLIYTRSNEDENSYILKMKINSFDDGAVVSLKIYNPDGTITNVDPSNEDFHTIFAKCLRDDPIIRDQIKALYMYDGPLMLHILSFIPRLVYLFKVVVYKGESSQYGDIPYILHAPIILANDPSHPIQFKYEVITSQSTIHAKPCTITCVFTPNPGETHTESMEGIYYQVLPRLIIATDQLKQMYPTPEEIPGETPYRRYVIYTYAEGGEHTKFAEIYASDYGGARRIFIYEDKTVINIDVNTSTAFATFLRKNPHVCNVIASSNMTDDQLFDHIMRFIPRLVYLSNVTSQVAETYSDSVLYTLYARIPSTNNKKNYDQVPISSLQTYNLIYALRVYFDRCIEWKYIGTSCNPEFQLLPVFTLESTGDPSQNEMVNNLMTDSIIGHHIIHHLHHSDRNYKSLLNLCIIEPILLSKMNKLGKKIELTDVYNRLLEKLPFETILI
uniref:Uncharacterized protein n=1 Tax=viral metagenome TaxID=1070528 RepID=A0A6C0E8J2_9ZZZZ